jgi:hypothetical protein
MQDFLAAALHCVFVLKCSPPAGIKIAEETVLVFFCV